MKFRFSPCDDTRVKREPLSAEARQRRAVKVPRFFRILPEARTRAQGLLPHQGVERPVAESSAPKSAPVLPQQHVRRRRQHDVAQRRAAKATK